MASRIKNVDLGFLAFVGACGTMLLLTSCITYGLDWRWALLGGMGAALLGVGAGVVERVRERKQR